MAKMLETWGDAQVVIHLEFVNGLALEGLVKEIDRNEAVIEPIYEDGSVGPLTVVNLNHVVMAYYDESPPDSEGNEWSAADADIEAADDTTGTADDIEPPVDLGEGLGAAPPGTGLPAGA